MKKIKLANFDNPKWTYKDLCNYAKKYREKATKPEDLAMLSRYNSQPRHMLIGNLKEVQKHLYK